MLLNLCVTDMEPHPVRRRPAEVTQIRGSVLTLESAPLWSDAERTVDRIMVADGPPSLRPLSFSQSQAFN